MNTSTLCVRMQRVFPKQRGVRAFCFCEAPTAADGAVARDRGPATAVGHRRGVERKFGRHVTKCGAHVAVSAGGVRLRSADGRAADALLHILEAVGVRKLIAVVYDARQL